MWPRRTHRFRSPGRPTDASLPWWQPVPSNTIVGCLITPETRRQSGDQIQAYSLEAEAP